MTYSEYIQSLFPTKAGLESVQDWRQYVLHYVMGAILILGTLVAIPSIVMLLLQGLWPAAVADVVLIASGTVLWRSERVGFRGKSWGLCVILYLLSFALLLMMGPTSQIYLMTSPVMAAILLGARPAIFFLVFNTLTLFAIGFLGFSDFQLRGLQISPWAQWTTIALNFAFVNAIITLSISLLLRGLEKSFEKVHEANRAKSEFLANMSHEIRTPMNAVLGMLKLTQATRLSAQQQDYLAKCTAAARTLLALINDILDFSKIEADKMVIDHHAFEIEPVLRNLAAVLSANNQKESLEVLFDVDDHLPAVVHGDALRIAQVLTNLASNAVKFTEQGRVTIGLRVQSVDKEGKVHIRFSVEDTGIGIAPDQVERIFSGFTQAEGSTTRKYGGTGLGLVISRRLVKAMGGHLELASEPGKGSCFFFTLCLPVDKAADPSPAPGPVAPAGTPPRLLLIDSHPASAAMVKARVQQWPGRCDVVDSEADAVTALQGVPTPYDAVLLDAALARQHGWQTARTVHSALQALAGPPPALVLLCPGSAPAFAPPDAPTAALFSATLVQPATASMLAEAYLRTIHGTPAADAAAPGRPRRKGLAGMRLLVVEDNAINQQVAKELLAAQGAVVDLADNGQIGVEAVARANPPYDAVLMDMQMPVMDGLAATRAIRALPACQTLPIVGLTANALVSDREACLQAGMNEHVGKPFDLTRLVTLLNKLTGRQAVATGAVPSESPETPDKPETTPYTLQTAAIDLAPALARMGHLTPLYISTAQAYATALRTLETQLQGLLGAADFRSVGALAHTYKGTAGTLGLGPLAAHLAAWEQACKGDAPAANAHALASQTPALVQAATEALAAAVQQLRGEAPAAAPQAADHSALAPVLQALREQLAAEDFGALEMFAEHRQAFTSAPAALLEPLEQALQELDMAAALRACDALLAHCQPAAVPR